GYLDALAPLEGDGLLRLPYVPEECASNHHLFYVLLPDRPARDALMTHLRQRGILAVFHYIPLHSSPMGQKLGYAEGQLPVTEDLSRRLLRLPLFYDLTEAEQDEVVTHIHTYLHSVAIREGQSRRRQALKI